MVPAPAGVTIPNNYMESHKIPWFQTTNQMLIHQHCQSNMVIFHSFLYVYQRYCSKPPARYGAS